MVVVVVVGVMVVDGVVVVVVGVVFVVVVVGVVMRYCLVRNDGGLRDVEVLLDVIFVVFNFEVEIFGKGCLVVYEEVLVFVDWNYLYIVVGFVGVFCLFCVEY